MTCMGCFEGSTFDALARQLRRRSQQPSQLLSSVIKRRMLSRRNSETQERSIYSSEDPYDGQAESSLYIKEAFAFFSHLFSILSCLFGA